MPDAARSQPAALESPGGRLTLIATGSRGDIQPQVALASKLVEAGWQVRFATHDCYAALLDGIGCEFFALAGDPRLFMSGQAGVVFRDRRRRANTIRRYLAPFMRQLLIECANACADAEALLFWPPMRIGPPLSEKLGIPCFGVATYPLAYCRTRAFPNPFAHPLPPLLRAASGLPFVRGPAHLHTWDFEARHWRMMLGEELRRWRTDYLGLRPIDEREEARRLAEIPHLLGFSPSVLPPPADWPDTLHVCGYWFLDLARRWQPPERLTEFLAAGPAPIAIGFGSMISKQEQATTEVVLEAVRRAGVRAVLIRGWGELQSRGADTQVLMIRDVPHDWLFSQVAGAVHHGGSGTTAASLLAGLPTQIVPFGFDQPLWGSRVAALGVGPKPISHHQLSARRLARSLRTLVSDRAMRARARALANSIRKEDGAGRAVELLARHLRGQPRGERLGVLAR